jgi:hypothetical protein
VAHILYVTHQPFDVSYNSFVDPFKYYRKELYSGLRNFVDSGVLLFACLETPEVTIEGFLLKFGQVYNAENKRVI